MSRARLTAAAIYQLGLEILLMIMLDGTCGVSYRHTAVPWGATYLHQDVADVEDTETSGVFGVG